MAADTFRQPLGHAGPFLRFHGKARRTDRRMDGTAAGCDWIKEVVDKDTEIRIQFLQMLQHDPHLLEIGLLQPVIRRILFVLHIAVKGAEKVVTGRTGIKTAETARIALIQSPVPFQGKVLPVDVFPGVFRSVPDIPHGMAPVGTEQLGAVRKKGNVPAVRIIIVRDLFSQGRDRKGAGAFARDQKLIRLREQGLAGVHGQTEIRMAVEMERFGIPLFGYIIEILPAQMHITGGIGDDQEIPVIERIRRILRPGDSCIDIHDLGKSPQIIPVIIGEPCRHFAAGHRPGGCIGIPGNAPSGQENTQIAGLSCLDINVEAGAVS